jgi:hypothetical protein
MPTFDSVRRMTRFGSSGSRGSSVRPAVVEVRLVGDDDRVWVLGRQLGDALGRPQRAGRVVGQREERQVGRGAGHRVVDQVEVELHVVVERHLDRIEAVAERRDAIDDERRIRIQHRRAALAGARLAERRAQEREQLVGAVAEGQRAGRHAQRRRQVRAQLDRVGLRIPVQRDGRQLAAQGLGGGGRQRVRRLVGVELGAHALGARHVVRGHRADAAGHQRGDAHDRPPRARIVADRPWASRPSTAASVAITAASAHAAASSYSTIEVRRTKS